MFYNTIKTEEFHIGYLTDLNMGTTGGPKNV